MDTVHGSVGRNDGHVVLGCVFVQHQQSVSVYPQGKVVDRCAGLVYFLDGFSDIGNTEVCAGGDRIVYVGRDCRYKPSGLVSSSIVSSLLVYTVDECVLDVVGDLLSLDAYLEVQFGNRIGYLIGNVDAGQGTHIGLFGVRNAYRLVEDLGHVGLLLSGSYGSIRCGQRRSLGDLRLSACFYCVFLTGREFNVVRGFYSASDCGRQRSSGVALGKQQTAVVQDSKTGGKFICHGLLLLLLGEPRIVCKSGDVSAFLRFIDQLGIIDISGRASACRFLHALHRFCLCIFQQILVELAL